MSSGRNMALDAIRGLAIGLVLLRHAFPEIASGAGITGVAIFFCLSGYLITGLLLDQIGKTRRVDFKRFYAHRAIRLLPALAVLLAVYVIAALTIYTPAQGRLGQSLVVSFLYLGDIPRIGYTSADLGHLWSLAIEEQFYIVWPAVLMLAVTYRKLKLTVLLVALSCLAAAVVASAVVSNHDVLYKSPTSWAITMVVGSTLAVIRSAGWFDLRLVGQWWPLALLLLLALSFVPDAKGMTATYVLGGAVIGLLSAVLIAGLEPVDQLSTGPVVRALAWLGVISYGAYLWNFPLTTWLEYQWGHSVVVRIIATALTVVVAWASFYWFEYPLQKRLRARVAPVTRDDTTVRNG